MGHPIEAAGGAGNGSQNRFYDACRENQQAWRQSRRRGLHTPELRMVARGLDRRVKQMFSDYIDPDFPTPIIFPAISFSKQMDKLSYRHGGIIVPETVKPEDHEYYRQGISHLDEWAANFVTNYFLVNRGRTRPTRAARKAYTKTFDTLMYGLLLGDAYSSMRHVRDGVDPYKNTQFSDAVLTGFFQHDFTKLNELIERAPNLDASNIDQLAVLVGKESSGNGLLQSVENTPDFLKVGGVYPGPGVTMQGVNIYAFIGVNAVCFGPWVAGFQTAALAGYTSFTTVHELMHAYSASDKYIGFLRTDLQKTN